MDIVLKKIDLSEFQKFIITTQKQGFLYCDFNVANFLVEQQLKLPDNIFLYPDSTFIHFILRLIKKIHAKKTVSTDIQDKILEICNQNKYKIFLFGDEEEILRKVVNNFQSEYPFIQIVGYSNGYFFNTQDILKKINDSTPDLILVGLGAGRQEKWIIENIDYIKTGVIISVGGYFRFKSGIKKRAPVSWRKFNLEWLYRVLTEFNVVWKRYTFGTAKFIFNLITGRMKLIYINNAPS